jgi:3-phenylpropionate/cinnamic acid dioxygenase small subunit
MYLHMDYMIQKILLQRVNFHIFFLKYLQLTSFFKTAGLQKLKKGLSKVKIIIFV